ncbi:MAG TPA: prenyltransferase/squalene oxidase repeat-containing protein [Bacteroidales bacterium]|nr:squalene--hopene cyclase [Bacteroidales bacterium]HQG36089.1 prenyltransferase/squalene oxidase repeat-containing protein [Bacteroidales bacterium]HRC88396.1 prenyltransferase/squalene oxidase repeat-containing protein [Bacteroidales bacterium]
MDDHEAIFNRYISLRDRLLAERNQEGFWSGRLATSALATAVAIVSLKVAGKETDRERIDLGFNWLCRNINTDGGYGDTPGSVSNVSTTLLCYAAIRYCQRGDNGLPVIQRIEAWLGEKGITFNKETITGSILNFYGKDYTFSIPILSMLIICGIIPPSSAQKIPKLPFELALLPPSFYRFFNLHVVSYALPALIAVGIYQFTLRKRGGLPHISFRKLFVKSAIDKLDSLVPPSGGFLEASPLTGFVSMCLIAAGVTENVTISKGIEFLRNQQREDGGWPIDTDLSTWVTTLSIKALGSDIYEVLNEDEINILRNHLLRLQFREKHPFNGAKPGGWGWTSYSGSVPDADDTSGAILALLEIYSGSKEEITALQNGCRWLIDIQNKDGGFPTFCKGFGKLPFDSSCADITGHSILALLKTAEQLNSKLSPELLKKIDKSVLRAKEYLVENQRADGSWVPLWFGNQLTDDKTNPVYGTAKVCTYLSDCIAFKRPEHDFLHEIAQLITKAQGFLISQQNGDGSWGGSKGIPGSIEETSLALSALTPGHEEICTKGLQWLERWEKLTPVPIGLYFAMLWYDEYLYPLIFYTEAIRRYLTLQSV